MQTVSNKDSRPSSVHSTSQGIVSGPSWWISAGCQIPRSSVSKSLNLNLDSPTLNAEHAKQSSHQLQDQESSSTQSTGKSHHEMESLDSGSPHGQSFPAQPGSSGNSGRQVEAPNKQVLTVGTADFLFPGSQVDYGQPVVRIPYTYADPYFGAVVAAYGAQVQTPIYGVQPARIPLPDLAEDAPIFVNAKQYHGILRRRESRAKLEAQNKLVKSRKPYLHESRHLHAMKRVRGSGGRFLNTKKIEESTAVLASDGENVTNSGCGLLAMGNVSESIVQQRDNGNTATSVAATNTEVRSLSKSKEDAYRQANLGYPSLHVDGALKDGSSIMHNGPLQRISAIR